MKPLNISITLLITFVLFPSWPSCLAQEDESLVLTFKKHKGPVYAIAISPDGKTIASSARTC